MNTIATFLPRRRHLVVALALVQLAWVSDTSRHVGLAFPSILIGLTVLRTSWTGPQLTTLILLNLLAPNYYIAHEHVLPYFPLPVTWLLRALN